MQHIEDFLSSVDGIKKTKKSKITVFLLIGIIFLGYCLFFYFHKIDLAGLIVVGVLFLFNGMQILFSKLFFSKKESSEDFALGAQGLIASIICWYTAALFITKNHVRNNYIILFYLCLWLICNMLMILGVAFNIKHGRYSQNLFKGIRLPSNDGTQYCLCLNLYAIVLLVLLAVMGIIQIGVIPLMNIFFLDNVLDKSVLMRLQSFCFFFMGWLGVFGWKLILKAFIRERYKNLLEK